MSKRITHCLYIFIIASLLILSLISCGECNHADLGELGWTTTLPSTCKNEGLMQLQCPKCNEVLETKSIPKLTTHTIVTDPAVEATTTSEGLTEGSHCSVCNEVLISQEIIPMLPAEEKDNTLFKSLTYTAFGDSITFGADYTRGYAPMDYPYPKLVSQNLGLESFSNCAISGSTIATNIYDLPSIYYQCLNASVEANIISVMGGVNDYNRSVELGDISDTDTSTFYGSLKAICETLLEKYPDAFIFLMTPYKEYCYHEFHCTERNSAGYNLEDYANAVISVAEKYNLPVLDMYNYGQYEVEMYNADSDGIHPSQDFILNYTAPQIAEFIRENYPKPQN